MAVVTLRPLPTSTRDLLHSLSRLSSDPLYHDIQLVCRDGCVRWNRFLLSANSPFLKDCLKDTWDPEGDMATILLPEVSSATLSTLLGCTLDHAVRRDILSVNEQQVMTMLGFSRSPPSLKNFPPPSSVETRATNTHVSEDFESVFGDILDEEGVDSISLISMDVRNFEKEDEIAHTQEKAESPGGVVVENQVASGSSSSDKFKCSVCQKKFSRQVHLDQHEANHRRDETFVCDLCGKVFYHENLLRSHLRYHKEINDRLTCPKCPLAKPFKGKRALKFHMQQSHDLIKCLQCEVEVPKVRLKSHLEKDHGAKFKKAEKVHCHICLRQFSSTRSLMVHRRSHEGLNGFLEPKTDGFARCTMCGKLFASKEHLNLHLNLKHCLVECDVCGKAVKNIQKHIRNVHETLTEKVRTKCTEDGCDKEFSTTYAAKYHHMKAHLNNGDSEKETCKVCDRQYHNLARHEREVHSENRFECSTCGNFFPVKQSLERHVKNVHCHVRNACPYCEKEVVHLAIHLASAHGMTEECARDMAEGLTGKAAARTDLQWTSFQHK